MCNDYVRVRTRRFQQSSLCNSSQLDQYADASLVNCRRKYSRKSTKQTTLHLRSTSTDSRPWPHDSISKIGNCNRVRLNIRHFCVNYWSPSSASTTSSTKPEVGLLQNISQLWQMRTELRPHINFWWSLDCGSWDIHGNRQTDIQTDKQTRPSQYSVSLSAAV